MLALELQSSMVPRRPCAKDTTMTNRAMGRENQKEFAGTRAEAPKTDNSRRPVDIAVAVHRLDLEPVSAGMQPLERRKVRRIEIAPAESSRRQENVRRSAEVNFHLSAPEKHHPDFAAGGRFAKILIVRYVGDRRIRIGVGIEQTDAMTGSCPDRGLGPSAWTLRTEVAEDRHR